MDGFQQFLRQLQQFWGRQSAPGRVLYGGSIGLLIVAIVGVSYWVNRTQYAVLFSGLPTEQAAAITQKLDAERIAYKLSSDGSTILVASDHVQKTRMVLAVAGLLQGTDKGFEIFDTMSMGATSFVQNVNYVRAIQGELAKSIMTLDPVQHARVHIVQPEPTPFVRDEQPVTASVVIKTRPGTTLSRQGAQAIVALVAGSVRGLAADNVTVLDADGRVLSEKKKSAQGMANAEQLAHQLEVESHLAAKGQEILTRLLGPGRAIVRVTADMSFRHVKESSEKFDPEGKVVLRESVMSSKSTGPNGTRGPAGTASNLPPSPPNVAPINPPSANEEVIESEYAVTRVNHQQEEQQENINRLTVAVMLIPPKPVNEVPLEESLGITPAEAGELVKQSVGFKAGRDQIQVSIGKPSEPAAEAIALDKEIIAVQQWQNIGSALKASSLGVAALSLLAIGLLAMRRGKPAPAPSPALATSSGNTAELDDLQAIAGQIRAWLEEPATIRMDRPAAGGGK